MNSDCRIHARLREVRDRKRLS
jgi:hypothetical protein